MLNGAEPKGIFVGLATLDVVHRVTTPPHVNEKITARAQFVSAGGPAANAAVTFAGLGGCAILVTALGADPVADLIRADLALYGVMVIDVDPGRVSPAPISAVAVTESTGDRSVVSIDAIGTEVLAPDDLGDLLEGADVVLVDGHYPLLAVAAARAATAAGITVVVDAGRWKPVMAELVPFTSAMICSNDFRLPGIHSAAETVVGLVDRGVPFVATTHGGDDVLWWHEGRSGAVVVPATVPADTLGAGDVFHGAYAYFQSKHAPAASLEQAARVAALRCSIIGPRAWLTRLENVKFPERDK